MKVMKAKHCNVRKVKGPVAYTGCAHCGRSTGAPWEPPDPQIELSLARQSQAAHRRHCRGSECDY